MPRRKIQEGEGWITDLVEKFTGRRAGQRDIQTLIEKHGNALITNLVVGRTEVKEYVSQLMNAISLGQFNKAKELYSYDKLWHLFCIITLSDGYRFQTEKMPYPIIKAPQPSMDGFITVPITKPMKISDFFQRAMTSMGKGFFDYHPLLNNCQHYISSLLSANGLMNPSVNRFTNQGVEQITKMLPDSTSTIAQTTTDLAGLWQLITGHGINSKNISGGGTIKNMDYQLKLEKIKSGQKVSIQKPRSPKKHDYALELDKIKHGDKRDEYRVVKRGEGLVKQRLLSHVKNGILSPDEALHEWITTTSTGTGTKKSSYVPFHLPLTVHQITKMHHGMKQNEEVVLRLNKEAVHHAGSSNGHPLMLTRRQIAAIGRSKSKDVGCQIKLSSSQLAHH